MFACAPGGRRLVSDDRGTTDRQPYRARAIGSRFPARADLAERRPRTTRRGSRHYRRSRRLPLSPMPTASGSRSSPPMLPSDGGPPSVAVLLLPRRLSGHWWSISAPRARTSPGIDPLGVAERRFRTRRPRIRSLGPRDAGFRAWIIESVTVVLAGRPPPRGRSLPVDHAPPSDVPYRDRTHRAPDAGRLAGTGSPAWVLSGGARLR
jgi:hypothetical protein